METDAEVLFAKDPKETLKKLKEFRTFMNSYLPGTLAEEATYEVVNTWLEMNRNRMIHNDWEPPNGFFENPVKWGLSLPSALPGLLKSAATWFPLTQPVIKQMSELDTSGGWISQIAGLKIGDKKVFGKGGEKVVEWMETTPRKLSQNVSYAVRYTGAKGNAFDEKQMDEILDQMLQMGIFNSEEGLYHTLRREMKAGLGNQVVGLIRKYWWLLPLLTAAYGAKEGLEEEKKR